MYFQIIIFILFFFITFFHLYFAYKNNHLGKLITKPLLMPSLILLYLISVSKPIWLLILALSCGFLGDVFLIWTKKQLNIMFGLSSFLVGHIFYIILFLKDTFYLKLVPLYFYIFLIPYLIILYLLIKKITPFMKEMKIPGIIYMGVLLSMSFFSASRYYDITVLEFILPFLGSILFILSDTILAWHIFIKPNKQNDLYIMFTYIVAQFFIILGFII